MKVALNTPPWGAPEPTRELMEAIAIMGDGVSAEAKRRFEHKCQNAESGKGSKPVGMQASFNEVLKERFEQQGWDARDGRFLKNGTFIRVSFRHNMSLGSDLLEALKSVEKDNVVLYAQFACSVENLVKIAPTMAHSMVSYEKLEAEVKELDGIFDIPLMIGELIPKSL